MFKLILFTGFLALGACAEVNVTKVAKPPQLCGVRVECINGLFYNMARLQPLTIYELPCIIRVIQARDKVYLTDGTQSLSCRRLQ